jgi:hypothetical protein
MIQTRDRFENTLDWALEGANAYLVTLVGAAHVHSRQQPTVNPVVVHGTVTTLAPNTDGRYYVSYEPVVAGNYTLSIQLRRSGGLFGTYYHNPDLTGVEHGRFPFCLPTNLICEDTQLDAAIDFNWGTLTALPVPAYTYPADFFSVVWTGEVRAPTSDAYTFHVAADGGSRLYVNGTLIIDSWAVAVAEPSSAPLVLAAGAFYSLRLEYRDDVGNASVRLSWSTPVAAKAVVPSSALYYTRHVRGSPMEVAFYPGDIDAATTNAVGGGLVGGVAGDTFEFVVSAWDTGRNQRFHTGLDTFDITVTATDGWAALSRVNDAYTGSPVVFSTFTSGVQVLPLDWTLLCSACASTRPGSTEIQVSANLTSQVRRGQRVAVGRETFVVHDSDPFTAELLPTVNPVMGPATSNGPVYLVNDGALTASHRVRYFPTIRGTYTVDVRVPRTAEVQTVTLTGFSAIGGTFTLGYRMSATPPLDHDISPGDLATAIATHIPELGVAAGVTVSATFDNSDWVLCLDGSGTLCPAGLYGGGVWTVTIACSTDDCITDVEALLVDGSGLTGDSAAVEVEVTVNGLPSTPIGGSPWDIVVVPATANAAVTTAFGRGLVAGRAGDTSYFHIQVKDRFGNDRLESQSRERFEVVAFRGDASVPHPGGGRSGPFAETVVGSVSYVQDGLYAANFTPTVAPGAHVLSVCMQKAVEVQQVAVTGFGTNNGGTFRLGLGLEITPKLFWSASAEDVQAALSNFTGTHGPVTVTKTSTDASSTYLVTFVHFVGDVDMLSADYTQLLPSGVTIVVTEPVKGTKAHIKTQASPLVNAVQRVSVGFASNVGRGGSFTLSVAGQSTEPLPYGATAAQVQAALRSLAFADNTPTVFVTEAPNGNFGTDYTITFDAVGPTSGTPFVGIDERLILSSRALGDLPNVGRVSSLIGNTPTLTVTVVTEGRSPFKPVIVTAAINSQDCTTFADDLAFQQTNGLTTGVFDRTTYYRIQARDRFHNAKPEGPVKEVQVLTVHNGAGAAVASVAGASFTLGFSGATTWSIPLPGMNRSHIEWALQALPTITDVHVTDVAAAVPQFAITFLTELGDVPDITVESLAFPSGGPGATVTITACDHLRVQTVTTFAETTAAITGSFRLHYGDEVTGDLVYNIAASAGSDVGTDPGSVELTAGLKQVLEALPSIVSVTVNRSPSAGALSGAFEWKVTFNAVLGDVQLLYAEGQLLAGAGAGIVAADSCAWAPASNTPSVAGTLGDNFVVRLTGQQSVHGDVIYSQAHSSGVYNVSYLTPSVGTYSMAVALAEPSGLNGSYFNNRWLFGTPAFTRVDPVVDFVWDSLVTPTGQDYLSVRWTGFVQPAFDDVYNFTVLANDGVKLWVDGVVIIDRFDAESTTDALTAFSGLTADRLTANRLYDIKLEFKEVTGVAAVRLMWSSNSQDLTVIPSYRLFHSAPEPVEASPFDVTTVGVETTQPTDPSVVVVDETQLTVSWFTPDYLGGEPITGYKVEWWSSWPGREKQTIKVLGGASGGYFTLTYLGEETRAISYRAHTTEVKFALEELPGIGTVTVTGAAPEWTVVFDTDMGDLPALALDHNAMIPAPASTVEVCADGAVTANCDAADSEAGVASVRYCASTVDVCAAAPGGCDAGCPIVSGAALDVVGAPFTYTLKGLDQGVRYFIRIRARNTQLFSAPSEEVDEIPRSPPTAPRDVAIALVAGSDSALQLYWRVPEDFHGNDLISYLVEWRRTDVAGAPWLREQRVPSGFTSLRVELAGIYNYTIFGLTPGVPYTARVSADNNRGFGPTTDCVPASEKPRTAPVTIEYGAVSVAPRLADEVVTVHDSVSTLTVTWQPPADFRGSTVDKYAVEWALEPFTAAREQRQTITLDAVSAPTGTFRIGYDGELTDYLAWDATAHEVKRAVDGLVGVRNTRVLRAVNGAGFRWTVIFSGHAGAGSVAPLTVDDGTLSGAGPPTMSVTTTLTTSVCATCATVTQFQDVIAVPDLRSSIAVNDLIGVGPVPEFFVVTQISASSITLSSPYQVGQAGQGGGGGGGAGGGAAQVDCVVGGGNNNSLVCA